MSTYIVCIISKNLDCELLYLKKEYTHPVWVYKHSLYYVQYIIYLYYI